MIKMKFISYYVFHFLSFFFNFLKIKSAFPIKENYLLKFLQGNLPFVFTEDYILFNFQSSSTIINRGMDWVS
jgi:hypothetical protein